MKKQRAIFVAVACILAAGTALGQDSVSNNGLGDAVSPWDANEQLNAFVTDLTPFNTSWGTEFGVCPLLKSSKTSEGFFSSLMTAQGISNTLLRDVPFPTNVYEAWDAPGFGVHDTNNWPGTALEMEGFTSFQCAVLFSEFATTDDGEDYNGVIGGFVNYRPADPGQLYIARIPAAGNGFTPAENRAQFGVGAIDADGNAYFRADDFGLSGPNPITGNNIFRASLADRDPGALNVIDNAGGSDATATDWLVMQSDTVHNPPTCVPEQLTGRPIYIGGNFNSEYAYELPPVTYTAAHRGSSPDHRGNVCFSKTVVFPDTVGTACMLLRDADDVTRILGIWGVNGDGSVNGDSQDLWVPTTITDNADGEVVSDIAESIYYLSQTAYRGGNGPVAVGEDQQGRALVASTMPILDAGGTNPLECVAVARFDGADIPGTLEWTVASWLDPANPRGKQILNGPSSAGGTPIGQIATLAEVTGSALLGPSTTAPCIDSVGNIWFISAIELYDPDGGDSDFDIAVLRAVYDPATFGYELELVVQLGDIFHGNNSDLDYLIRYIEIADSNSISSGTMWSGNIVQDAYNGMSTSDLEPQDPRTLGGLVFSAGITYDSNEDGEFDFATGDEGYNVLVYVRALGCAGDVDGDGDTDLADLAALLAAYNTVAGDPQYVSNADIDADGDVDLADLASLLAGYGCGS